VANEAYEFGEFTLNAAERRLSKNGCVIPLEPKAHDVLLALVRNAGRLLTKRKLLELVWPDSFVEEGILAVHISALRRALGDQERRCIETVPRSGYRFTAAIKQRWSIAVLPAQPLSTEILGTGRELGLAIADAVIDRLGRFDQIVVRPTRAVHAYMNVRPEDPAEAGRSLGVDAVVDCRFVTTADGVRVSAHLVRSGNADRLWSGELGAAPDAISDAIAAHLRLSSREDRAVPRHLSARDL
jgi:DNA-binding winged helix-turn-helix (wHTH) protein